MLSGLKKIVLRKKRWICIILISVIVGVAFPKFVYYLSVRIEMKKTGRNVSFASEREFKKKMGGKYLMVKANVFRSSGSYRMAVRAYRNIAKKYPEMAPTALYEIIRTYELSGGRDSKKIKAYQEVIQRFPDSEEAGKALEKLAKSNENQTLFYQGLIKKYPDKFIARVVLAETLNNILEQQNKEEAQKLCLKYLMKYPDKLQIAAYKRLVFSARQNNNIQPVVDFSYFLIKALPDIQWTETVTLSLADMSFQKGNYSESLYLRSGLEKKRKITEEKIQPEVHLKQPEVRKAAVFERPDIYRRIENLARTGRHSPGYIKELAKIFFVSEEVCDILADYNDKDYSSAFFVDEAKALFKNRGDLKENMKVSGFTAEEKLLLREILQITDGKVIAAYQKLVPTIGNDKAKNDLVKYLSAYILATRNASRVVAETDIFFNEIPMEFLLPVLLCPVAETKEYQYGLSICREIINRSPKSADVAMVLENVGDFYRQMKMNAEAIKVYKKIVLEYPEYPGAIKAQEKIIDTYAMDWKIYPNAINECFELVRIFPESTEAIHAQFTAGKFYRLAGNYDQASATLQNFISKYPKTEWVPEAYLLIGLNHLDKQENNLAVEQLRTLIREYSKHELASRAQFLIGYCFLSQQKYDDALREYKKLVTNYPESSYDRWAKEFIRRLSKMD